mgnify:FL=1
MAKDRPRTTCGSGASDETVTPKAVSTAIAAARAQLRGSRVDLGFVFASPQHALAEVLREARRALPRADVLGCTTAGEITERGLTRGGVAIMLCSWGEASHLAVGRGPPLSDATALARELAGDFLEHSPETARHAACLLLGDGLAPELEQVVTALRTTAHHRHPIVGAGAGDDGKYSSTAVGLNREVFVGGIACVQISSSRPWGVGVAHGLTPSSKHMTVTKARGNVVLELDHRPALEAYREYASSLGLEWDALDLPQFLVENELGVLLFDELVRIRAPLRVLPDGALFVAGEVPESSTVCIVRGTEEEMIAAARTAAEDAKDALKGVQPAGVLLFSCVCRAMTLGARYAEEIRAIQVVFPDVPLAGLSSYGEVASTQNRLDGYHNDTIVVVAIPE